MRLCFQSGTGRRAPTPDFSRESRMCSASQLSEQVAVSLIVLTACTRHISSADEQANADKTYECGCTDNGHKCIGFLTADNPAHDCEAGRYKSNDHPATLRSLSGALSVPSSLSMSR